VVSGSCTGYVRCVHVVLSSGSLCTASMPARILCHGVGCYMFCMVMYVVVQKCSTVWFCAEYVTRFQTPPPTTHSHFGIVL
jgi:hypothetical protein